MQKGVEESMMGTAILLIDHFENVLSVYRTLLEEKGYQVDIASDLEKSAIHFSRKKHRIVILEYIDSLEKISLFIQWIKKAETETYIILNTSIPITDQDYQKLMEEGLDDYLLKPYSPEKLLLHIKKGLRQVGMILENEKRKESFFDPLAQKMEQEIFTPPYFKKELRRELKKSQRHGQPMSLLLLKIPNQEEMGQKYESFYGNLVKIIKGSLREEDVLGRENGKLGILLSQTTQAGSITLGQRLAKTLQNHPVFESDDTIQSVLNKLSFQYYTFPSQLEIPGFLNPLMEDLLGENPPRLSKN